MTNKKTLLTIPFAIVAITLLAAGCNSNENTLKRPTDKLNSETKRDQGEVAGTETVQLTKKNISVNSTLLEVEIADTDIARQNGLSNRSTLTDNEGMLFDFRNTQINMPGFWMKDILISIDMIWINNGRIVGITPNVPIPEANKNLDTYYPPSGITHVLEVPAGWSQRTNAKVGDVVTL